MTRDELASLSFAELRDRLKARIDQVGYVDDIDWSDALRYLTSLPDHEHTEDSGNALIELGRNYFFSGQPEEALLAGTVAARIAIALENQLLLCRARSMQGVTLRDLGRFNEAAVALAETWMLADAIGDVERAVMAIRNVGGVYVGMAQWEVAAAYNERARAIAAEHGLTNLEFQSRNDFAVCAHRMGDPIAGLRALLPLGSDVPITRLDMSTHANAHDTLAHLYLATGDTELAKTHAEESGRLGKLAGIPRITHLHEALMGLIDVKSGEVERGLAAIQRGLDFARRADAFDVADYLGMCIDAYEAAGQSDKALMFLQELVAWKKKSVDAELLSTPYTELKEPLIQSDRSVLNNYLLLKEQRIQTGARQRIQHYVETAINAEISSGHDLYRTFRLARLARYLAAALGWDEERISSLALGAQLCNIGMISIPTRILLKLDNWSDGDRLVVQAHTQYGAELLRRSKIGILDRASVIAAQHHEHYDGGGYPCGLSGESIAQEARLVAVCDAFDAMTHKRLWRKTPLSIQAALSELRQQAGAHFDPLFVNTFTDVFEREFSACNDLDALLAEGSDEFEYVRARARMETLIADR
jgi:HD-GYP domain-containing protein (c-di-GMP phosphodiesterase class II)